MLLRSSGGGLPATYLLVVLAIVVVPGVVYGLHPKEMPANYFSFEPNLPPRHHLFKEEDNLFIEGEAAAASIKLLKGVCGQRTQWIVKDHYSSNHNGLTHLYLRQIHNGLEIANSPANINVDKSGRVINLGEVCYKVIQDEANLRSPTLTAMEALLAVASHLGLEDKIDLSALNVEASSFWDTGRVARSFVIQGQGLHSKGFLEQEQENVSMELAYLQNEARRLNLTWHTVLRLKDNWFDVHVDAHTGKVLSLIDWVRWDSYEAYAIPNEDPLLGDRQTLTNPADKTASPIGWLDQGTGSSTQFTTTVGNNVYAQLNPTGRSGWTYNYRPDGDKTLSFQFPIDFFSEPYQYRDAAVTNLFFWNNVIHDIFYLRGFNESAGNFQENNFNKGGLGNDAVQANAQDGSGYNNANFATPPDGQRPRMRMYLWNQVTPMIDGDLDSGIIVHEYGHGISTRLTGGPNNSNCLASGQAGGMGEGWGDFWATIFLQTPQYKPSDAFPMGIYAAGRGIRPYPYSADFNVDPQTYGYINKQGYNQEYDVHAKGSVWCTILWEVYWEMVTKHGFDSDWYRGSGGNNALLQDVVDGLKLQPCRPNFVDARNAILLADKQNYGGKYVCDMWAAFARRGLGYSAVGDVKPVVEAFDVPTVCLQN